MKPKLVIIPTIDVEGTHGERPFAQLVLGEVGLAKSWGVYKIANILSRYGATGTFFIDVYEHTFWGTAPWEQVCVGLVEQGQDVQLHTHPGWRMDPADSEWIQELKRTKSFLSPEKDFMAKLNLSEQTEVLQYGRDLMYKWLGVRPIAHRSGGYSINENTILALRETGFKVDSSQNCAHPHTKIKWTFNALARKNDILQIPVTVYDLSFISFGPRLWGTYRRRKTDLGHTEAELMGFCKTALKVGLPVMNLFMHSYSLLKMDKYFTRIKPDQTTAHRLEKILHWAARHPEVEIMSIKQYHDSELWRDCLNSQAIDTIPRVAQGWQLILALFNRIRYTLS